MRKVSRDRDPELFHAAVGGYGLFGVIVEVELDAVPDEMYRFEQRVVASADVAVSSSTRCSPTRTCG